MSKAGGVAANRTPRIRIVTGVLFMFPMVELISEDLMDLFSPSTSVHAVISQLPPHPLFHVLTPSVGFFGAAVILGMSIAFGPYLSGERWAWWALALADLALILAVVWGTLTIYVHSISNGIIPELWLPAAVLALAVLISWSDFNSSRALRVRALTWGHRSLGKDGEPLGGP